MPTQATLDLDSEEFEFKPLHPRFTGTCEVLPHTAHVAKQLDCPKFTVDLDAGTCTCPNGGNKQWHGKHQRWEPNLYCSHKLRAMADIMERDGRPADQQIAYAKALASRYNMYEVVSTFHKELRRANVEQAVFWGTVLGCFRGIKGVNRYLLNILYEETRDHTLGWHLLKQQIAGQNEYEDMCRNIALFARSKKKWDLPHRMKFLQGEMDGYRDLIAKYGRDVAQAGNIIANKDIVVLRDKLILALKSNNLAAVQFGLKGLQKLKVDKIDNHRASIVDLVDTKIVQGTPIARRPGYKKLYDFINERASNGFGIGYHELNAYIDFVTGETYEPGNTSPEAIKAAYAAPAPKLRLGVTPNIPLYAQDNHTWAGKALIRRFPSEWQPGATQENMDLRLCGAYIGVVYRHLAVQQFGRIDCEWGQVGWPNHLADTVSNLWY